jgi:Retinal pigment epithelial membrane protein
VSGWLGGIPASVCAVISDVTRAITATGDFTDDAFTNAILKHDLDHGTVQAHEFGRDATAGEAVFAPAAPDAAEDDVQINERLYRTGQRINFLNSKGPASTRQAQR